ncbi:MAG: isoprenylcysteine carboxylmethyltransferase family protein [Pseudomonadota bacterium]
MTRRVGRNFGLGKKGAGESGGRSALGWLDLPPLWLAAFALVGLLLARFLPIYQYGATFGDPFWGPLGFAFIGLGLAIAGWAAATFAAHKTTLLPGETPSALVSSGPYRFSRNPIYLADLLLLAGWCVMLGAITPFLLIAPFAKVLEIRFIAPEEARLAEQFPDEWAAWSARVRRWI